ncbi:RluA family pseudouridine synthase [Oceanirhabdus sp. W0125-5]|uniref:RluA family pseudouridine synthase n=1 Tax=Oceanirhabdus sp. W0125-5 TaxID=2999116 RepID=UPI0022F316A9|nr:RluA family pseudouridine synthase [Oceanirhabdus sp. W0125-5]WBW95835.1 RluA family pseudouridine synthase [Oceanirhabdus sp. W0125-5]
MKNYLEETIHKEYEGYKVVDFLKERFELSRRFIKKASMEKRITLNGQVARKANTLAIGDIVKVELEREETQNIPGEKMDIKVVYEDKHILIVNKDPYMVVHPTKSHPNGTLSNGVKYHFEQNGEDCIVRMANRLDMNTSGLVMVAKNQFAHMKISTAMQNNRIVKEYKALVKGKLENKKGTIDAPIGRRSEDSIKREVFPEGARSITHYEVVEEYSDVSLLKVRLETGRTHQIRVHLNHLGHPIVGDELYGSTDEYIDRQALHAYKLVLPHPYTGETVEAECELPDDILECIEKHRE